MWGMSSETAKVYFGSVKQGNRGKFASFAAKVDEVVKRLDLSTLEKKDKVAIKMHLGYEDGYQTIPVFFVRRIVEAVKKTGAFPFITDNPTSVYNAVNRGYTSETCGCPLIPFDGVKDKYLYKTKVDFKGIETLDMGGVLHDSDALIDLSHAKGHNTCGYGGAIKNLAIGAFSAQSRWAKYHNIWQAIPYWKPDTCTPEHAKKLVESCPDHCITYKEAEHKLKLEFDMCNQCMKCIQADKGVGSLELKQESFSLFQELMAIGTSKVLENFPQNKRFFINFLIEITAYCDCWGVSQPCIVNDIGVLGSRDIVAIEKATLDLIAKEGLVESMIPLFFRPNLDRKANLHPFARIHGPMKNPYLVLDFAEKLGLGSKNYELVEVLSPASTAGMKAPTHVTEVEPTFF